MNNFNQIILYVGIILLGYFIAQFRLVLFKVKTLQEVLSDKNLILIGVLGVVFISIHWILFERALM